MTLVTEIMMDEAGYIVNEILQDCKRQTDLLKIERDRLKQHQIHLDIKTSKPNKLNIAADGPSKSLQKPFKKS